jgi:succinyl-CoA synthetase beta subunit
MQLVDFDVAKKLLKEYKVPVAKTVFCVSKKDLQKNMKGFIIKFGLIIKKRK